MRVVVRREASVFDALSLPFQAAAIALAVVFGILTVVPILIAIEIKAAMARHRIRKEREIEQQDHGEVV